MRLPLRIVHDAGGLLGTIMDAEGRLVAHCADPCDALELVNGVNGSDALLESVDALKKTIEQMDHLLRTFKQSSDWHDERKRLIARLETRSRNGHGHHP